MSEQSLDFFTYNLAEDLSQELRQGNIKDAGNISPYFACLFPLLEKLGWSNYNRDIIESLPYGSNHLNLVDLRNVLVNLGYESHRSDLSLKKLHDDLFPVLYVGNKEKVLLILERNGNEYKYFDGNENQYKEGKIKSGGILYLFTDLHQTHAVNKKSNKKWFTNIFERFGTLFRELFLMTFILNLIIVSVPLFIMTVYDRVIGAESIDTLPYLIAGISFALLIELGIRLLRARILARIASRIDYLIGSGSFKQILDLPPIMTDRSSVTAQLSKIREFDSIRDFFAGHTVLILLESPFILLFIGVMALLGGWIAVIPVVTAVVYSIVGFYWVPRMQEHLSQASQARTSREQILIETFNGIRELKALGSEGVWLERYKESTADSILSSQKASVDKAVLNAITSLIMMLAATMILAFGTMQVMEGLMSIGALIAIMTLSWRVLAPIQGVFLGFFQLQALFKSIHDLNHLMSIKTERHGRKSSLMTENVKGNISFERVSFKYTPTSDPVLLGVSFNIPPKAFVAVVGNNGAGKSTLLKLINGIYAIQSGTVYIDNTDTRQFNTSDLRRMVAYVPQNPSLFRGTIMQNLRLKDPLASDDDVRLACFKTGILKHIEALPKQFDTIVGDEDTRKLPSGLIQGICIARALVSRSPVILLDEPASGLDSDSDESLMLQLRSLKGQVTLIMVSHRPSHIKLADRVLVLEHGTVKNICKPDEYYAKQAQEQIQRSARS